MSHRLTTGHEIVTSVHGVLCSRLDTVLLGKKHRLCHCGDRLMSNQATAGFVASISVFRSFLVKISAPI